MDLNLADKTVFIAAASKGIGAGLATAFAREGARVAISSSSQENLDRAKAKILAETGVEVGTYVMDVGSLESVSQCMERVLRDLGHVDILVPNGPGPKPVGAADVTDAQLLAALTSNLMSTIAMCRAALPAMKQRRFGRIIILASSTGREPDAGMTLSNVARAGVLAYVKTLSREVGSQGITVNAILTGGVMTERTVGLIRGDAEQSGRPYEEVLAEAGAAIPAGYIASPEQFVPTLVFLASEAAAYVNGVNLPVDGGYMKAI
ncbi:SDR family oxidoreductase [Salinarimonas sp. NSM]|uniref:SDR family oxidoreductase n=1 Tax=Salinarimonas sp. NSM TaxID=3458003 RepID=UPI00403730A6